MSTSRRSGSARPERPEGLAGFGEYVKKERIQSNWRDNRGRERQVHAPGKNQELRPDTDVRTLTDLLTLVTPIGEVCPCPPACAPCIHLTSERRAFR